MPRPDARARGGGGQQGGQGELHGQQLGHLRALLPHRIQPPLQERLPVLHLLEIQVSFCLHTFVQGDPSCCLKPSVDYITKVPYWPGL